MALIELDKVNKKYLMGEVEIPALHHIDLQIHRGDFFTIAGPSGSGKSTLLNIIGCLDTATEGSYRINSRDVSGMNSDELAELRANKIGFIFQLFNLIPVLNAYENVEFPLLLYKSKDKGLKDRIMTVLDDVGLKGWEHHRPDNMSGGQRQRVAIARALVTQPEIVLADEPTANLDSGTGADIIELMSEINRKYKTTFIFSTHDPMVLGKCSAVIYLKDGRIEQRE